MRFLSLFSGIEAASEAWVPLGWQCVGVSEIEPDPCLVLAHRHPGVPNLGDVTKITEAQIAALGQIDVLVFGSPCQDLSIAGKQKGFQDGTRSSLFFTAVRIAEWARMWCGLRWALWENVPGAFSSNKGRDFAEVVKHLAGLPDIEVPKKGWGTEGAAVGSEALVEWAVLDAQWFGVAQRRRRVFALADFGDWSRRPPILLERESLRGNSPPSRQAWQKTAGTLASRASAGGFPGTDEALSGYVQAFGGNNTAGPIEVATALNACGTASGRLDFESETFIAQGVLGDVAHTLTAEGFDASEDGTGRGNPLVAVVHGTQDPCHSETTAFTLGRNSGQENVLSYSTNLHNTGANNAGKLYPEYTTCLDANSPSPAVLTPSQVRRLTVTECERLQGFPDHHTLVPISTHTHKRVTKNRPEKRWRKRHDGKFDLLASDSARYKALGNSMAVPVMAWIGKQIDFVHIFFEQA